MNKQEMIDKIYEVIANKTLSMGCLLQLKEKELHERLGIIFLYKYVRQGSSSSEGYDGYKLQKGDMCCSDMRQGQFKFFTLGSRETMQWTPDEEGERICDKYVDKYFGIIGHPVVIGDVLSYRENIILEDTPLYSNSQKEGDIEYICRIRLHKNKPIENQSEECIKFVYSLLPTK